MHRLEPSVDVALEHHLAEHPDLGGFVLLLQCQIRLVPVGPDPPALKPFHLPFDLLAGIGRGLLAKLDRC